MQNTDCFSTISHELRNPLTLIYSSLQLLEKECPAVCESGLWPQIKHDVLDTIQLLRNMTASFGVPVRQLLCIQELIKEITASFSPAARMRQIRFESEIPADLPDIMIMADRQKIREAVFNLLINAADAIEESIAGSQESSVSLSPGKISLSIQKEGPDVCIHIRDNGPGIPPERLATLFHSYVTYRPDGFGLGLAVSESIAKQHGGSLTADTCTKPPETYTDFCIRLPICSGSVS